MLDGDTNANKYVFPSPHLYHFVTCYSPWEGIFWMQSVGRPQDTGREVQCRFHKSVPHQSSFSESNICFQSFSLIGSTLLVLSSGVDGYTIAGWNAVIMAGKTVVPKYYFQELIAHFSHRDDQFPGFSSSSPHPNHYLCKKLLKISQADLWKKTLQSASGKQQQQQYACILSTVCATLELLMNLSSSAI